MCTSGNEWMQVHFFPRKSRRIRVRILELSSVKKRREEEMEMKNLKLYMENMSIFEENEKLRRQATLLHQQNLALMSEILKTTTSQ
ncbi:hypothetical protein ACS0TY_001370 [Phlomoides rotata]